LESKSQIDVAVVRTHDLINRTLSHSLYSAGAPWQRTSRDNGFSFKVVVVTIVEYIENTNMTGFDANDTVVSSQGFWGYLGEFFQKIQPLESAENDIRFFVYSIESVLRADFDPTQEAPFFEIQASFSDFRGYAGKVNRTLSPSAIRWDVTLEGYPFKSTESNLCLKFAIETKHVIGETVQIPQIKRDDPGIETLDIPIYIRSGMKLNDTSDYANLNAKDTGYLSFETTCDVVLDSKSGSSGKGEVQIVPIISSNVVTFEEDWFQEIDASLESLDETMEYGDTRYYVYFSIPVKQPNAFFWQFYIGIDEYDVIPPTQKSSGSLLPHHYISDIFVILLIIICTISFLNNKIF